MKGTQEEQCCHQLKWGRQQVGGGPGAVFGACYVEMSVHHSE